MVVERGEVVVVDVVVVVVVLAHLGGLNFNGTSIIMGIFLS